MRSFYQDRLGTNIGKALKTQTTVFWQVSTNLHVIETRECKEPSVLTKDTDTHCESRRRHPLLLQLPPPPPLLQTRRLDDQRTFHPQIEAL
jgi:hypothetical protein